MRDSERVRRTQSGILFGLSSGVLVCTVTWLSLAVAERQTDWDVPAEPAVLAGIAGLVAMLAGARWGER